MRARSHSADPISSRALLAGIGVGSTVLVSVVALPLAFSNPFPTPREGGAWILDNPPFRLAAVSETGQPEADGPVEGVGLATPAMVTPAVGDAGSRPLTFDELWNLRVPQAAVTAPALDDRDKAPPDADPPPRAAAPQVPASQVPASQMPALPDAAPGHKEHPPPPAKAPPLPPPRPVVRPVVDPVEQYLWEVYLRRPVKSDSTGDFTWKDQAAAKRLGMTLRAYVIGGMDPDFREQLYHAGRAMDAAGLRWSMLSAFRDDYRQGLAAGFKAHGGNSLHGGSRATGGYGHGRAVDITSADGNGNHDDEAEAIWRWIDAHGGKYGLSRPMPRIDPAHINARGSFHDLAHDLREARLKLEARLKGAAVRTRVAHADK